MPTLQMRSQIFNKDFINKNKKKIYVLVKIKFGITLLCEGDDIFQYVC